MLSLPWAQKCFLSSAETVRSFIEETSLNPLVALGMSFTAGMFSIIISHHQYGDQTLEIIYSVVAIEKMETMIDEEKQKKKTDVVGKIMDKWSHN